MDPVPEIRIKAGNAAAANPEGGYVLYWMTGFRRLGWNYALQHAVDLARTRKKPLVVLEVLLADYPFASLRLHRLMLEGMAERAGELEGTGVVHHPFVERTPGEARGLLSALASRASVVVTDEFPTFILPDLLNEAKQHVAVRLDLVDSNGLLPLRLSEKTYTAAYHFRRFLQKSSPEWIGQIPDPDPLADPLPAGEGVIDQAVLERWPAATGSLQEGAVRILRELPLDQSVVPVDVRGGTQPARALLNRFLEGSLDRYQEDRNHPDREASSGLSPYLHFGNISSHEIFSRVTRREGWTPLRLSETPNGSRTGWWGLKPGPEAFLDQLVTWRELGFNMASTREDVADYDSLPEWARRTLEEHEGDPRPYVYAYADFRDAETHDPLWNAAQRQLLDQGVVHGYLRMLWGKKILEWTRSPREALGVMIALNDRYAVDGRDPNSYSGILWCLGRYDRGWPERPVYGKVRSMSSDRTRKKVELRRYLERFGPTDRP